MQEPIYFSRELDADPDVRAWLDALNPKARDKLRDDVTPLWKELPFDIATIEDIELRRRHDEDPPMPQRKRPPGYADEVRATLERDKQERKQRLERERERARDLNR